MQSLSKSIWGCLLIALPLPLSAQSSFLNGNFDSPGLPTGQPMAGMWLPGDTFVTGWTAAVGYDGTFTGTVQYIGDQGHDPGGYSVELGYYFGTNAIEQTFTSVPDQWYMVSFWLATNPYNGPPAQLRVSAGGMWEDFQAPAGSGDSSEMGWEPHSFAFLSENSGMTTLWFGNLEGIAAIDAIAITAVPETRTFGLLGLGTLAFILRRKHRVVGG